MSAGKKHKAKPFGHLRCVYYNVEKWTACTRAHAHTESVPLPKQKNKYYFRNAWGQACAKNIIW